jgi:hypothetical protein
MGWAKLRAIFFKLIWSPWPKVQACWGYLRVQPFEPYLIFCMPQNSCRHLSQSVPPTPGKQVHLPVAASQLLKPGFRGEKESGAKRVSFSCGWDEKKHVQQLWYRPLLNVDTRLPALVRHLVINLSQRHLKKQVLNIVAIVSTNFDSMLVDCLVDV